MKKITILLMLTCIFMLSTSAQNHFKIRSVIQAPTDLTNSKWEKSHPVMHMKIKQPDNKPILKDTEKQTFLVDSHSSLICVPNYSQSKNTRIRSGHVISSNTTDPKTCLGENGIYYSIVINHDNNHPYQYLSILKNTGDPSSSDWTGVINIYDSNEELSNADLEIISSADRGVVIFKQGTNTIESFWFQLSDPTGSNGFTTISTGGYPFFCSITSDEVSFNGSNVYTYITWSETGGTVKFDRSTNQGSSWDDPIIVAQNLSGLNMYQGNAIAYCPGNSKIYVAYLQEISSTKNVTVAEQANPFGTGTFTGTNVIIGYNANCPGIASYENRILVTTHFNYNGINVCYVYSDNLGSTWSNIYYFNNSGNQVYPSVSVNDNGYFCLLYCGDTVKARRNIYNNLGGSWSVGTVENVSISNPTSACLANGTNPDYGGAYPNFPDTYFGWAEEPNITVTSPNGGENWQSGSTHDITWGDNISGNVLIELYKGGSFNSTIISSTLSNGSYSWTIPSGQQAGTDYSVKITSVDNSSIYDFSDGDFEISSQPQPHITLAPDSHDFGSIQVGNSSSEYSFTLTNDGTGTATGSVSLTGSNADQFEITSGGGSFSLSQNQTKTINVKFNPSSEGAKNATLFADGDSPCNDASSSLSGTGVLQPQPHITLTPASHDFGSIQVGSSSSEYSFTLTNDGTGTATGFVSLIGTNVNQFTITMGNGSFSLNQNNSITIKVKFNPTSVGTKSAGLKADGISPCNDEISTLSGSASSAGSAPVANFSGYPTSGNVPLLVSFTDLSSNSPTLWSWNFGDGGTSSQQNSTHTYQNAGTYTISLTATNQYGNNTKTKYSYIHVDAISLSVSPTTIILAGQAGSTSYFEITSNTSWQINGYPSWLDLSNISGMNNETINITTNSQNTTGNDRTSILNITANNVQTQHVTITQQNVNGIDEVEMRKAISVYPNPASTQLFIRFKEITLHNVTLSIYDIYGNRTFYNRYKNTPANYIKINLLNNDSGVYYIHIKNDKVNLTKQFIVVK